jgi:GT2 family glycosyltransferase
MDVSIVIVNWNTCDLLRGCLQSIYDSTKAATFEIFVVDNASRDESVQMVRTEFPQVNLIANTVNAGFAAANNQGIRLASGRYVLLLNPDTIVLDRAIERCIAFADQRPDVGVVGCQVLEDENRIQRTGFSFPTPLTLLLTEFGFSRAFPKSRIFGLPELGWWERDSEQDIDVISGMFMLVRADAIMQVGVMDEAYFVYSEEADWCFRFSKAGWRRVFTPSARIIHLDGGGKSTSQINTKMFVQLQKSSMIYQRKNLGVAAWLAAKVIYIVSNFVRATAWRILSIASQTPRDVSKWVAARAALKYHLFGTEPV